MSDAATSDPQGEIKHDEVTKCNPDMKSGDNAMEISEKNGSDPATQTSDVPCEIDLTEKVTFTLVYNKAKHKIEWPLNDKVSSLKHHIHTLTKVPPPMQKLMYRGMLKDAKTLRESGVTNGVKMMVIGSKLVDVMTVDTVEKEDSGPSGSSSKNEGESLCTVKPHSTIIEKGIPDDAMPGYVNGQEVLPSFPLKGLVNMKSNKVRLTFKLETDELWIGTKDRTEKLPLTSIKDVRAIKIDSHPEYHFLGLQLGPTERSRYWVYWVPSQYVEAIKDAILGWKAF